MNVTLTDDRVRVKLSLYEKIGGVAHDLEIPYGQIERAELDPEPFRTLRWHFKAGLRLPGLIYVCWTGIARDFWAVRRGQEAVRLTLRGRYVRHVTVSDADARGLVDRIAARA